VDRELGLALQRAERWLDRDRPEKAVDLLEPLVASAPDNPDLRYMLGYARVLSGDIWDGLSALEEAKRLGDDVDYLVPLAGLYADVGLPIHALRTFREIIDRGVSTPLMKEVREAAALLERDLADTVQNLDRSREQVEDGLYDMERGQRAVMANDFSLAVAANQRAIRRLGDWPPAHNNLAQALFYDGQPEEAMREVRRVLAKHPENLHALANGVRILAWSGGEKEARDLWARLEGVVPRDAKDQVKKAEAAAIVAEHESVYRLLKPLVGEAAGDLPHGTLTRAEYFLAVAEANSGRRQEAERRLSALQDAEPLAAETLSAVRMGRSGTGFADHFRYFHLAELLPAQRMEELLELLRQEDEMPPRRFRRRVRRFAERFPQVVRVVEKMIWEERQPEAGIGVLRAIATPQAYAALRRFGTSQAGGDRARLEALTALAEAGEIGERETVRAWVGGEWREIELQLQEMPEDMMRESDYAPPVRDTLNRALTALQWDETEEAEELFERVLELNPNVKEAHNNLGAIYARRGEDERAKQAFRRAVEIDPLYPFPVCNLVTYLLYEERDEEAEELLAPLSEVEGLLPQERAFYSFTRARLLVEREAYDDAEQLLQDALEVRPDYEPAQDLLEWIEGRAQWSYWEELWERDRAWRERLQEKLSTLKPTLDETLPLYTKAALTGMARKVMPWGGWSSLRKAELVAAVVRALTQVENMARMVERLDEEEQEALCTVLDRGGAMPWDAFDARYDNDLDESRHWEYHTPETVMGRLRLHGLLAEALVDDELYVVVPVDLREELEEVLSAADEF
jgi:tetratricopeptide (TPR) repeat protein